MGLELVCVVHGATLDAVGFIVFAVAFPDPAASGKL
jgi:hypothetical protein